MPDTWTVHDAAARLDEVIRRAADTGPQILTDGDRETAVLLSPEAWHRLTAGTANHVVAPETLASLKDLLIHAGPKFDDDVVDAAFARPHDMGRDVEV